MTKIRRSARRVALSAIFGIIIALGLTAAAGGVLFFTFQDQTSVFTASSAIQVQNLSVQRDGDKLSITGTIKNTGSTSISEVTIDTISVSKLDISQNQTTYILSVGPKTYCQTATDTSTPTDPCHAAVTKYSGFSLATDGTDNAKNESVLEGGRTNGFKLTIVSNSAPVIKEDVNISDNLTLILQFKSGQDVLFSDTYQARVRSG